MPVNTHGYEPTTFSLLLIFPNPKMKHRSNVESMCVMPFNCVSLWGLGDGERVLAGQFGKAEGGLWMRRVVWR